MVIRLTLNSLFSSRKWPVLERARGALDAAHFDRRKAAFDVRMWQHFPRWAKTLRFRHLGFKMLHRCGAMFYQNIVTLHRMPPFLTLMLLREPAETTAQLRGRCEKMLDDYATSFMKFYDEDLTAMDALIELLVIDVFSKATTVHLENTIAYGRRLWHSTTKPSDRTYRL